MLKTLSRHLPPLSTVLIGVISLVHLVGCNNSRLQSLVSGETTDTDTTTPTPGDTFKISTVTFTPNGSSSGGAAGSQTTYSTSIFFNTSQSTSAISNHCESSSSTKKPCKCVFTWQEINTVSGNSVSIPRLVETPVTLVQPSLVSCNAPLVYGSEILDGTTVKLNVAPSDGSDEKFTVALYTHVKSSSSTTDSNSASFRDAQGRAFINILRYSCYDQKLRGMSVQSKMSTITHPETGETATYPLASQFCVAKYNSNGVNSPGCTSLPPPDYTAQSYYYNLFIRENAAGDINPGNSRYVCPKVLESLNNAGNSTGNIGTQGQYWPLDSTFALSMGKTSDFPIGVVANTKTSNSLDPGSAPTDCESTNTGTTGESSAGSLVRSCLGFAARPNSDGTCPSLKDPSGVQHPTYRLRRYYTLYPPIYDSDGAVLNIPQAVDTIYVLDRPVAASTNPDPEKPYTMRGPKPCPFAYFDHKLVLDNSTPSYAATDDNRWRNKNVDGIQFPNRDTLGDANTSASCAAALPVVSSNKNLVTLTTIHSLNNADHPNRTGDLKKVYIRPIRPWSPHYEEDTAFQGCAPASSNFRDPPLHFARHLTTGNVAWCAETYPTQNNNIAQLEKIKPGETPTGNVRPFTSHTVKNSLSAGCSAKTSSLNYPSNYPATGKAKHLSSLGDDQTCDRTALNPVNGITWPRFPLQADAPSIENTLSHSTTENYACMITYDHQSGKTNHYSPSQGCCGANVKVWSGSPAAPNNESNAHLEPDAPCLIPNY